MDIEPTSCCGVKEIEGLGEHAKPQDAMAQFCHEESCKKPFRFLYTFTGVVRRKVADHSSSRRDNYGAKFAAFIRANHLGQVVESPTRVNPNTGNTIRHWTWAPAAETLKRWAAKHPWAGEDTEDDLDEGYVRRLPW